MIPNCVTGVHFNDVRLRRENKNRSRVENRLEELRHKSENNKNNNNNENNNNNNNNMIYLVVMNICYAIIIRAVMRV